MTDEQFKEIMGQITRLSYQIAALDKRVSNQLQIAMIEMDDKVLNIVAMIPSGEGLYIKVK